MSRLTVLIPDEGETLGNFVGRIKKSSGDVLVLLGPFEKELFSDDPAGTAALDDLAALHQRLRLAVRLKPLAARARSRGLRVVDRVTDLRALLKDDEKLNEALRAFSPNVWRQQLRSRLQAMGLLSLPKLRIWILLGASVIIFFFVAFRLLPSAEIAVTPREDTVTQTSNIFLVQSGATVEIPARVRTLELRPIRSEITRTITFDQITKEFIGTSATVAMTISNESEEQYSLREGSRLANQAGMVFRILEEVIIEPGEEIVVRAEADDLDLYGEIIGDRGNVPAGIRWYFAGLEPHEKDIIYAENSEPATGGTTGYRTVLHEEDLVTAEAQLKQELLSLANQLIDEQIQLENASKPNTKLTRLYYDELTKVEFRDIKLPREFLGEKITSVPVEGTLVFVAYAYDAQYILDLLKQELATHVEEDRALLSETVTLDRQIAHVMDYGDDLSWIKLTVDLSGTQQYSLDPLSPSGARFAKRVREAAAGLTPDDARRIIGNFPEVEKVDVSIWPPWSRTLPEIPYHISVRLVEE